ncbi:putative integral membrane protein [Brugia pahangi]|uniref:SSD domain-containing protein n=1 Tax=Brugia pahangi TaxID=6280 RepID=A0A0N4TTE6_BRUPA|nr:unnamed protein product [Brugia pahangi]
MIVCSLTARKYTDIVDAITTENRFINTLEELYTFFELLSQIVIFCEVFSRMSTEDESIKEVQPLRKIGLKEKLQADPGFPLTVVSTAVNFTLSSVFFYGVTGNPRASMLAGLISIPFCIITNILDTEKDYKIWKEAEGIRARGLPEILISRRPKYDWDYYEPLRKEIERFYNYDTENKQEAS